MRVIDLVLLAWLGSVAAQSTTTLFLFGFDPQNLVATVKGHDATATTYLIQCPPGTDSSDCGVPYGGYNLTQGPSTVQLTMSVPDEISADLHCKLEGTTSADCTETINGPAANYNGTSSMVLTGTDLASAFLAVSVTDESSPASTGASVTAPTASATRTTRAGSASSTGSGSVASTGSQTPAGATSTSHAGVPQMTGNAQWAVGGAAMALALAAL